MGVKSVARPLLGDSEPTQKPNLAPVVQVDLSGHLVVAVLRLVQRLVHVDTNGKHYPVWLDCLVCLNRWHSIVYLRDVDPLAVQRVIVLVIAPGGDTLVLAAVVFSGPAPLAAVVE